jgi:hypothetical protein
MKKILIILFCFLFLTKFTFPQGLFVNEENAKSVAEKFYFERVQNHRQIPIDQIRTANKFIIKENGETLYYIFNLNTGGFVAVSAIKSTFPILCYSFSGRYNNDDQPDNFKAWMGQYGRQISYAIESKSSPSDEISALWRHYLETPLASLNAFSGREVLPMLTSTWDQGTYYNAMCPEDPAGPAGHCVTGCVATALGQLLNYFRWPETGTGSYSYDCPPYGTLSADFSNATYEWDLMENELGSSNPEVAEIIYHLGVSVDMVYGPDGSGMYNHKAAYTLKTYFKYSPETQYVFRDSTTMDWDSLLVTHLNKKIPMYYAGWSVPDTNGHAFICDGYQGENFYHFNWGWSGSYDGYFYTDELTPGGSYFNLAQELVIHAVSDTNLYTYPVQCQGEQEYEALNGTVDDGSGPLFDYANSADCSWLITPNDSINGITLSFHRFDLAAGDSIKVYDGVDTNASVLGTFSGDELPPDITTTGSSMFIHFTSNDHETAEGFLASFDSVIPDFCNGMVMMTEQTDSISDGSGSWNYHDNSTCLWGIMPEGSSSVTLYFTEFSTETGFDLLKIYDLQTQQVIAEYSGTYPGGVPDPVTSPSGKMFITFTTNSVNTAPGWEAYFESNLVHIDVLPESKNLLIYPNPTDDFLNIKFGNNVLYPLRICLTDLSGRKVYTSEFSQSSNMTVNISLNHLSPGIYLLEVIMGDGKAEYLKVIKD